MESGIYYRSLAGTPPGGKMSSLALLALFAVAMAYLEAAIVVYLRDLYYPQGFTFPLVGIDPDILLVEIGREASSLVMLFGVAWFSGRRAAERFAMFCMAFAVWDIFYYVWLKIILDWPSSPFTWDVLFLIPVPWIGPVLSPLLVSVALIVAAVAVFRRLRRGGVFRPTWLEWTIAAGGGVLIVLSYTANLDAATGGGLPESYRWELLIVGLAAGLYALGRTMYRTRPMEAL